MLCGHKTNSKSLGKRNAQYIKADRGDRECLAMERIMRGSTVDNYEISSCPAGTVLSSQTGDCRQIDRDTEHYDRQRFITSLDRG